MWFVHRRLSRNLLRTHCQLEIQPKTASPVKWGEFKRNAGLPDVPDQGSITTIVSAGAVECDGLVERKEYELHWISNISKP